MKRKMILLIEGYVDPLKAKTAVNLIRYCREDVVAVFDSARRGATSQSLFGFGGRIPVIGSLDEAPQADTLVIGIAPAGGKLPAPMRTVALDAVRRGINLISGLHDFVSDDRELSEAAGRNGANIWDVRKNNERDVAHRTGINPNCLRIHTVGHDCNVGKMVVSLELSRALNQAGRDAKFVATGQTGIMIEGDGCAIDAVVADFINGAAERLVLANQHHEILLIEGQGSLIHPRYSAVTLGLLHGCIPHGLILCYEMGRATIAGMEQFKIPPLTTLKDLYETAANIMHPCQVIGVAINGRRFSDEELALEREKVRRELNLPACDVLRHGAGDLVEAILRFQSDIENRAGAAVKK